MGRRRGRPVWPALIAAALWMGGCGKSGPGAETTSAATGQAGEAPDQPAGARTPDNSGTGNSAKEIVLSSEELTQIIRDRVAAHHGLAPDDINVKLYDEVSIPGVTLFTARQKSGKGASRKFSMGAVHGGEVELDRQKAMTLAIKAWGYGKERTVPPADVAYVVGLLEGTRSTPKPILSEDDLEFFKETGRPEYAAAAFLPRETTVDGLPAVEYCNRADRPAFWIATAVIRPDGTVDIRRKEAH